MPGLSPVLPVHLVAPRSHRLGTVAVGLGRGAFADRGEEGLCDFLVVEQHHREPRARPRSTSQTPRTPVACAAAGTTSSRTWAMPSSMSDRSSSNVITWAYTVAPFAVDHPAERTLSDAEQASEPRGPSPPRRDQLTLN
jgi:hypothetical protein